MSPWPPAGGRGGPDPGGGGGPDPGGVRWGAWSLLGSPAAAELLARSGCDWLVLDGQHGLYDDRALVETLALLPAGPPVLVRVPSGDAALIGRALDAGAAGVVVPVVQDAAHAADVAAACRYPPTGHRSWSPMGELRGRPVPAPGQADGDVLCVVMVETAGALADAGAIAAAPGVDAVLVGPFDLSLALGTTLGALLDDDAATSPLRRVVRACTDAGVVPAAFAGSPDRARQLAEVGFTAIAVATDAGLLREGAAAALHRVRKDPAG